MKVDKPKIGTSKKNRAAFMTSTFPLTFEFQLSVMLIVHLCALSILRSKMIQNELVLMNFLYSHCVPIITNCAEVKELSSVDLNKCNVALNDSIRFIFSYNRWESTRFLRQQLKFPNIVEIFHSRRRCFWENNRGINNVVIRGIMRYKLDQENA